MIFKLGATIYFSILLAVYSASCSKSSSKSSPSGGGGSTTTSEIEVSGSISDEAPVEFVQSYDSVNISGVNLTSAVSYVVTAYSLEPRGSKKLIFSGSFAERNFSFKSNVDRQYIVIEIKRLPDGGQFGAVLPPPSGSKKASVLVDGTTTIAAKMASVIASKAASGDQEAQNALTIGSVSVADILMVAQSVRRTVAEQKEQNKGSSIDLSALASHLVLKSNELVAKLKADGQAISQISEKLSEASYKTVFGEDAKVASPGILAYRVNPDLGSNTAATSSVAYEAIKASASESMKPVDEAFRVEATAYRTAATVASAVAAETQVASAFKTAFNSCVSLPSSCAQTSYTPPAPPSPTMVNVTVPGAPTSLLGTVGNAQVALNWAVPNSNGGADISDYVIEFKKASDAVWTVFSDGVSVNKAAAVSGLDNGVTYNFRIAAKNSKGVGTYSEVIIKTPLPTGCTGNGFCSVDGRHYVNGNLANGLVVDDKIVLLMHMDASDGLTSISDSSALNRSITKNGSPTISSEQSKFGGASLKLPDSYNDYLDVAQGLDLSSGSWTVEAWFLSEGDVVGNNFTLLSTGYNQYPNRWVMDVSVFGGNIYPRALNESNERYADTITSSPTPYTTSTWSHLAWVNNSDADEFSMYVNGVRVYSGPTYNFSQYDSVQIGQQAPGYGSQSFFLDEFRITKGLAQYTGNFTPPTAPFPNAYVCYVNGQDSGSLNNVGTGWCPGNSKYYIGGAETSLSQVGDGNFAGRRYVGGITYSGFDNGVCYVDGMSTNLVVDGKGPCGGKYYIGGLHQPGLDSSGNGQNTLDTKYYVNGSIAEGFIDDKTVLLMHFDGVNNSTTFTDSGSKNLTFTPVDSPRITSANPKFGSGSFEVSQGSITAVTSETDFSFPGDFTVEGWFYFRENVARQPLMNQYDSSGNDFWALLTESSNEFAFYGSETGYGWPISLLSTPGIYPTNAWTHVAVIRSQDQVVLFLNGVEVVRTTSTVEIPGGTILNIGGNDPWTSQYFNGQIDELRITKGLARYTSGFIPPQAAFATVPKGNYLDGVLQPGLDATGTGLNSIDNKYYLNGNLANGKINDGTVLLLHMDGLDGSTIFIDSSVFANSIGSGGAPTINATQAKFGGASAYFDGTSYLSIDPNSNLTMGDGDFTAEAWVNWSGNVPGSNPIHGGLNKRYSQLFGGHHVGSNADWTVLLLQDGALYYQGLHGAPYFLTNQKISADTWTHISLVRKNGVIRFYINGVADSSSETSSQSLPSTLQFGIGGESITPGAYFSGYIDELRLIKGRAQYSGDFTVPAEAFTNCYTNGVPRVCTLSD
ncbi:MAG: LamG-like jellyroll fold domain-containing protein [bacterium]